MTQVSSFGSQNALFFDHAILVVQDLESATRQFQGMGFTVIPGGIHAGELTHNALIVFKEGTYLELLAPYSRRKYRSLRLLNRLDLIASHPSARTPLGRRFAESLLRGQGINDFALGTSNLVNVIVQAGVRGLDLEGPAPGGRVRPDGLPVSWQTGCPPTRDLPFLIEDATQREVRVPGGEASEHANQVKGVAAVKIIVADLAASTARYAALLGKQPGGEVKYPGSASGARVSCFLVENTMLVLEQQQENHNDLHHFRGRDSGRPHQVWLLSADEKAGLQVLDCSPWTGFGLSFMDGSFPSGC